MDTNLLNAFFEGNVDVAERSRIVTWASASEKNSRLFIEAKTAWVLRNFPNERADADDFLRFSKHTTKIVDSLPIKHEKKSFANLYRIAAMIAVPLLFAAVFQIVRLSSELKTQEEYLIAARTNITPSQQISSTQEHIVNTGVQGRVTLPDGSEVWLNSSSLLRSPSRFDSDSRVVELEGEAFFKINGSEDWPFYIHTQRGVSVRVTGTEFNISSYANDPFVKVTLIEGNLTVIDHASERIFELQPMQELILQDDDGNVVQGVALNVQEDISWKDGFLMFNNTPFDAVLRRMERWYGINITVEDPEILNFRFTAKFEGKSLAQVLEIFKISSNIQHRINGNQVSLFL